MDKRLAKTKDIDRRQWQRIKGEMLIWSFDVAEIGKAPLHAYSDFVRGVKSEAELLETINPKLHEIVKWYVDAFIVDMGPEALINQLACRKPNEAMDNLFFAIDIEIRRSGL